MTNKNLKKAFKQYGEAYVENIIKQLMLNDKVASHKLLNSISFKIIEGANGFLIDILAEKYLYNVDKGRKVGTLPNVKNLQGWAANRKIRFKAKDRKGYLTNEQVGWAISRSIEKKGIKPSNVLKKAKATFLTNKKALNELVAAASLDVTTIINDALKNLKTK